uniref:hypothetical protein n=1 Tax=Aneurinibacillus tyrosinisolvens TaxID=1443435 RepID=UPI000ABAFC69
SVKNIVLIRLRDNIKPLCELNMNGDKKFLSPKIINHLIYTDQVIKHKKTANLNKNQNSCFVV